MKTRKKTKVESSVNSSQIDPKLKNMDDALENYITNYYEVLKNIFIDLYKYNCSNEKAYKSYDMTITYRFFFDKIILNSEKLSELFQNKQLYVELISWNFKDNIITNKNISNIEDYEMFEYLDTLYDYEMIFREFCELVFYISRKYFVFYDIDTKWEDFKMGLIINNDEKKTEDKFKVDVFKHSFKRNLCKTFLSFGKITVPDEKSIELQIIPSVQTIENKELEKDLKMCAGWREIMDTQFYPEYRLYAMAAEHLSHGDLDYARFKTIVNYHYYGALDPKNEFFRNSYSKPLIQFMDAYKLCEKYGYEDFFSEVKNYFYEMFMKEHENESECA